MAELVVTPLLVDAALLSYWRFEGNSTDSKGSNNGTDTDITYSVANGKYGQGAGFNGTSSKILTGNNPFSNANLATASVSFWFNHSATNPSATEVLFDIEGWVKCQLNTSGHIGAFSSGDSAEIGVYAADICDAAWHHIVFTWDANDLILYVDNVSRATPVQANAPDVDATTRPLGIGSTWAAASFFGGQIDDMAVFSKRLSTTEIATLFNPGGKGLAALGVG